MASLKRIHLAKGAVNTTDGTTWVTLAAYTLSDNAIWGAEIWTLGKDSSGNAVFINGFHAGQRVAGTITFEGGTGTLLNAFNIAVTLATADSRLNISGNDIQLQVKGVAATTIEWIGGITIKIN